MRSARERRSLLREVKCKVERPNQGFRLRGGAQGHVSTRIAWLGVEGVTPSSNWVGMRLGCRVAVFGVAGVLLVILGRKKSVLVFCGFF